MTNKPTKQDRPGPDRSEPGAQATGSGINQPGAQATGSSINQPGAQATGPGFNQPEVEDPTRRSQARDSSIGATGGLPASAEERQQAASVLDQDLLAKSRVPSPESRAYSRRDLLVRGGTTVAIAGLAAVGTYLLHDPRGDAGLQQPSPIQLKNYFAKIKADYPASAPRISAAFGELTSIDEMVRQAVLGLDPQLGMKRFIARSDIVCIKPNVGFDRGPELGATTHPDVVRALVKLCIEAGAARVIVADNPIENPAACFAKSGIRQAAEQAGAQVLIHSGSHDAPVQVRPGQPDAARGEALGTWPIFWRALEHADKVIGVAPIKDHNLCFASMNMKNWYGLLGGRRNQFHQAIHNIVSDLGLMMSPTLVVADGTRVMMSSGPTGGRLEDVKPGGITGRPVVVASIDQLACDSWCLQNLLGRDPAALTYLNMAFAKFGNDPGRIVAHSWQDYKSQNLIAEVKL